MAQQAHIGSYGRTGQAGSSSGPTALDSVGGQWVDRAAQIGLVARGVVYVVFGLIAFDLATGDHSGKPSSQGALTEMAQQPYGTWLLGVVALGLFAYAVACALGAIRGRGGKKAGESDTKDRVMDAGRAVINASLAVYTVKILLDGRSSSGSGNTESKATAMVLDWPGGQVIVAVIGLAIIAAGIAQWRKAYKQKFTEGLALEQASDKTRRVVTKLGTVGYVARGIVFALVGWFLRERRHRLQPGRGGRRRRGPARLAGKAYGPWVLGFVGIGTIAFGVWSAVEARYRKPTG